MGFFPIARKNSRTLPSARAVRRDMFGARVVCESRYYVFKLTNYSLFDRIRFTQIGDYVDIKVDSSQHKGMPYLVYQGRTGVVWDVTPHAVGVEVNKQVGGRIIRKRLHIRYEHVQHSRCREDFLARRKANDEAHAAAKKAGKKIVTKRAPVGLPREGFTLENVKTEILTPIPYDIVREGVQL